LRWSAKVCGLKDDPYRRRLSAGVGDGARVVLGELQSDVYSKTKKELGIKV
jgi:hypothetical protein